MNGRKRIHPLHLAGDLANNWTEAMNPFFHVAFMLR